ncbi:zinc finger CCCH-type antiviral protein 1-like [Manis pentadactyla]|uniref:zinc finger CCCH-type antiviral protein 1-like n=1 Tax=Manis pentadactyla TaxID=143292 RepID=UPI00255CF231|nr:zinc finger CCCH-type antiviral protein 1-like [Manis pentadactyla]
MAEPTAGSSLAGGLCSSGGRSSSRTCAEPSEARLRDVLREAAPRPGGWRPCAPRASAPAASAESTRPATSRTSAAATRWFSARTATAGFHTPVNIQVLKNHGLLGLHEAQLQILLSQNDPCLYQRALRNKKYKYVGL